MPSLLVSFEESPYKEYAFPTLDVITIGRSQDNHVILPNSTHRVSRSHAALVRCSDTKDEYFIRDLGSASGIKVGGVTVERKLLSDGDVIAIADYKLWYFSRQSSRMDSDLLRIVRTRIAPAFDRGTTIITGMATEQMLPVSERQELLDELKRAAKGRPTLQRFANNAMQSLLPVLKAERGFVRLFTDTHGGFRDTAITGMKPNEHIEISNASFMELLQRGEAVIDGATLLAPIMHAKLEGVFCIDRSIASVAFTQEDAAFVMKLGTELIRSILSQEETGISGGDESCRWPRHLVGKSKPIEALSGQIRHAAASDLNVLLIGEPGSGKGLIAEEIHQASRRSHSPFIIQHCSQLPPAGTMANDPQASVSHTHNEGIRQWFQMAQGGTLYLSEIQTLSPTAQSTLLSLMLRKKEAGHGEAAKTAPGANIIASTSDIRLESAAQQGAFSKPLLSRFGIKLHVPPLREHKGDIPLLAHYFLDRAECPARSRSISHRALRKLTGYEWPGNAEELERVMLNAAKGKEILLSWDLDLPFEGQREYPSIHQISSPAQKPPEPASRVLKPMAEIEKEKIMEALEVTHGNKSRAARELGWSRQTLLSKMRKHKIPPGYGS